MQPAGSGQPDASRHSGEDGELACYVHIPFCARVCPYCDFAVVAGQDAVAARYVDALLAEFEMEQPAGPIHAVFVGGGTPSRLSPAQLASIVTGLDARFGLAGGAEITLEANPEDWGESYGTDVMAAGFTRVSLGVQSFDDVVLADLGRVHTAETAVTAVEAARRVGIPSLSVDLIFGAAAEDMSSWATTVQAAIGLGPDHVSAYALTVERGTELSRRIAAGSPAPDPDDQAAKYEAARDLLTAAGFDHYEVSNYAQPGHACRYNLNTWAQGDYLAFGLGAHGHRQGIRRRNVRRLDAYLTAVEAGARPEAGTETITGWDAERERVFLGLRRSVGVEAAEIGRLLEEDFEGAGLVAAGKVLVEGGVIRVLDPLFADAVARVVLDLPAPAGWE